MPSPLLSARAAIIAAVGALAALAAVTSLTAARADATSGRNAMAMQGHEAIAIRHPATFWFGAPGRATDVDRTIRVKARDLSFDPPVLEVKAGETVRFIVTNARAESDQAGACPSSGVWAVGAG